VGTFSSMENAAKSKTWSSDRLQGDRAPLSADFAEAGTGSATRICDKTST